MTIADGRHKLVFNGEIYNFLELRKHLNRLGYTFKSNDTEVVLYSLIEWGAQAFDKFNGMFASSMGQRKRELLLGRDRYGIKPLYIRDENEYFCFGSEKAIVLSRISNSLDIEAVYEYFTFQNIFTNKTLHKGIEMFPAGHYERLIIKNGNVAKRERVRYWDYKFTNSSENIDKKEYLHELQRLFKNAVERQMVSDVEIGSYLSGGIDSGSITSVAAKIEKGLKTFTCGFDLSSASGIELAYDERQKAEAMSGVFKTEHYEMVLKAGDMERCLKNVVFHIEEPRVGQSYPNYYAAKLASKFVKVVLSGTGGDELFAGYPWRYYKHSNAQTFDEYIDSYYSYWQRLASNTELKEMFSPVKDVVGDIWTRDIFSGVFANHQNDLATESDFINHSLYFEAKTFLHGLLTVEDKLSMANGLEVRVPFLDNDLVEFAMKCPLELKLGKGLEKFRIDENIATNKTEAFYKRTASGKRLLREAMRGLIPNNIIEAKSRFLPDASWFKGESAL